MCQKKSPLDDRSLCAFFAFVLFFLLSLVVASQAHGQGTEAATSAVSPTSEPSETPSLSASETPTLLSSPSPENWRTTLLQNWRTYDSQFQGSMTSLEAFFLALDQFGISYESLPSYITYLESSLKASQEAVEAERVAAQTQIADQALVIAGKDKEIDGLEVQVKIWRWGAIGAVSVIVIGGVIIALAK